MIEFIDNFSPDHFADATYHVSHGAYGSDFSVSSGVVGGVTFGDLTAIGGITDSGEKVVWYDPRNALPFPLGFGACFIAGNYGPGSDATFSEWSGFTDSGGIDKPRAGQANGVMAGFEGPASDFKLRLTGYDDADAADAFDFTVDIGSEWPVNEWSCGCTLLGSGLLIARAWLYVATYQVPADLMLAWEARNLYPTVSTGTIDYMEAWGYAMDTGSPSGPPPIPGKVSAGASSATSGVRRAWRRPTG